VPVSFHCSHVRQSIDIVKLHVSILDCDCQALVHLFRFSVWMYTKAASQPPSFPCNFSREKSLSLFLSIRHSKHSSWIQFFQHFSLDIGTRMQYMRKVFPSNMKHSRHALLPQCRVTKKQTPSPQASDQHAVEAGYPLMQKAPALLATLCENCSMNRFMQLVPSPPPTSLLQQQFLFANLVEQEPIMNIERWQIARYELQGGCGKDQGMNLSQRSFIAPRCRCRNIRLPFIWKVS
jgi:hypothetical protein